MRKIVVEKCHGSRFLLCRSLINSRTNRSLLEQQIERKHEVKLPEESEKHLFVEKLLSDIDIAFTEQEISKILVQGNTQSELKNLVVEEIARKIETEYSPKMKN